MSTKGLRSSKWGLSYPLSDDILNTEAALKSHLKISSERAMVGCVCVSLPQYWVVLTPRSFLRASVAEHHRAVLEYPATPMASRFLPLR
jgi:hypothetical protein